MGPLYVTGCAIMCGADTHVLCGGLGLDERSARAWVLRAGRSAPAKHATPPLKVGYNKVQSLQFADDLVGCDSFLATAAEWKSKGTIVTDAFSSELLCPQHSHPPRCQERGLSDLNGDAMRFSCFPAALALLAIGATSGSAELTVLQATVKAKACSCTLAELEAFALLQLVNHPS